MTSSCPMEESGITWVGLMPAHWATKRAKFLFSLAQREPRNDDGIVTAFRDGQVTLRSNRRTDGFTNSIKEAGYQGVRKGDLVIHAMDAFAGAVGVSDSDGKCTPVYSCCIPNDEASADFYARCVRTMANTGYIGSLAKGIRERSTEFRWAMFAEQRLPVPPRLEQSRITDYLDRSTAGIDALIIKKTRFIALLREKRQALITNAVTRGLDAAVNMKETNAPSLLGAPAHWHVVNLWTIVSPVSRIGMQDVGLLSVYLDRGVIPYSEGGGLVHKPSETLEEYQLVEPGNFVLNNQQAWRGSVGVSKHRGIVSPAYLVFELSNRIDPDFANYQFRDQRFVEEMMLCSQGVGDIQRQVKWPLLRYAKVFLPPLPEQLAIVAYLDRATARIDMLIEKSLRSIDLLREHRAALITAAVTGKIDLRETA